MDQDRQPGRQGQIAVIFTSRRTAQDDEGYAQAAAAMDALAAHQPGYLGIDSARDADGFGISVSWWADEAAALAWREHPVHTGIRNRGREHWYTSYEVAVARVERSYGWSR